MFTSALRVFVLEDDPNTLRKLEETVQADERLRLVGSETTLGSALSWLQKDGEADIALVDLDLPDGHGSAFVSACSARSEGPDCLVMTVFGDEQHVLSAIEAGAVGYLLKEQQGPAIGEAICATIAGGSAISPSIARQLLRRFRNPAECAPEIALTPREEEVLQMIVKGFSYRDIASQLELSIHTVTSHIQHIYRKLAVGSRGEAVFEAVQLGLVKMA